MRSEGLRERQKATRREAILEAARTIVAEAGYDAVTLDAVAERASLTKPTLYAYFENRDELILAAYLRVLDLSSATREELDPEDSALTRLSTIFRRVLEANFAAPDSFYAWPPQQVLARPEFVEALDRIRDEIADLVREGQKTGEIATDLDPVVAVQFYFSIAGNPTLNRLLESGTLTSAELVDQLHEFLVQSFRPPAR